MWFLHGHPGYDHMKTQFRAFLEQLASFRLYWTGQMEPFQTSVAEPRASGFSARAQD